MRLGLLISFVLHAALIGWGVANIGDLTAPRDEIEREVPVTVDIVDISDVSQVRQGVEDPKEAARAEEAPTETPPAEVEATTPKAAEVKEPPKRVATLPPAAAAPPPAAEPEPPAKVEPPKAETPPPRPRAAPSKAPSPARNPRPRRDPPPKRVAQADPQRDTRQQPDAKRTSQLPVDGNTQWSSDNIAALLNKVPDAESAAAAAPTPAASSALEPLETVDPIAQRGQVNGFGDKLSISEFDFFMRQIGTCWNPPVGAANARDLQPVIAFKLREDGSVDGIPRVVNRSPSPFYQTAVEAAVRAIKQCQPYSLPIEKYEDWANNEIEFDPSAMFGG